jgi:hypothetical protein
MLIMQDFKKDMIHIACRTIGDNWTLDNDSSNRSSLTEVLEAYFQSTGFNRAFYIEPLKGDLYYVPETKEIIKEPKTYEFYGEIKQGK